MQPNDKILLTGAGGFLGKYVEHELKTIITSPDGKIITAGLSPYNDVSVDLTRETLQLDLQVDTVIHLVGACFSGDFKALNVEATQKLVASFEAQPPKNIVFISTTEVYGATDEENVDEDHKTEPTSEAGITKLEAENILSEWCAAKGVNLSILRAPAIVGTGMQGPLRAWVNSIYRSTYHHIADETARMSVVHATDVARAACLIAGHSGVFNITDGVNPSQHDLAEALAARMGNKRIFTLRPKRARIFARFSRFLPFVNYNKERLAERYRSLTFDCSLLCNTINFTPQSVTNYLTTHVYDETSL